MSGEPEDHSSGPAVTTLGGGGGDMSRKCQGLMTRGLLPGLLAALIAISACQPRADTANATVDRAADEAAIRHVLAEISRTFNAGDYEGMFALYRDDVLILPPNAPEIVGKQAWRTEMQATLPPNAAMKLRFDTQELEIAGDLAYERGTYLVEAPDAATGALAPVLEGRHIHMFRREADGSWKGWRLMENSADPLPVPAPVP